MAESMKGLKRSHRCTELSINNSGEEVTVMGWVHRRRDLGGLIFYRNRFPFSFIRFPVPAVHITAFMDAEIGRDDDKSGSNSQQQYGNCDV